MSAPAALTWSGYIAFTVPAVPTGMKAGVRTTPRGMRISPVRASPSVLATPKVKRSVKRVYLSKRCPLSRMGWVGTVAKGHGRALTGEVVPPLPVARKRRARADGVDPYPRCERLRHGLRRREESALRQRVGEEVGRRLPDALVDHVDDGALDPVGKLGGEVPGQEDGRPQVHAKMPLPYHLIEWAD